MSIWNWVHEFAAEAAANEDEQRMQLLQLQMMAGEFTDSQPEVSLAFQDQARSLAVALNEKWWVLFVDHWRLQVLLHYKKDYREVLDIAVQAALESRKPEYANLPQRICLHEDLINSYLGTDPIGYSRELENALDYMQAEVSEEAECRYCIGNCRTEHQLLQNDLEAAEHSSRITLQMADGDPNRSTAEHHAAEVCGYLCVISHRREDWQAMEEWAEQGEELAKGQERPLTVANMMMWRALADRMQGREEDAQKRRRLALKRLKRVNSTPSGDFFDALCAFHLQKDNFEKAAKARRHECKLLKDKGRFYAECRATLALAQLLAQLGEPFEEELAHLENVAKKLRDPEPWHEEIAKLRSTS